MISEVDGTWESARLVSVAGGYWTGSSAVTDILQEHLDCVVPSGEFMLFSFGQFFQEVTTAAVLGVLAREQLEANLYRFAEFNSRDRGRRFRGAIRRLCAIVGIYPVSAFSRRSGASVSFGGQYRDACSELARYLRHTVGESVSSADLGARLEQVLYAAAKAVADFTGRVDPPRAAVFDQMVGPPYIPHARQVLPSLLCINVDRDWRDQYLSLRRMHRRLVGVNRGLGVRPWDEADADYSLDVVGYFVRLRRRIDEVRQAQESDAQTLWLNFEDVVLDSASARSRICSFIDLDPGRFGRERHFFPERSAKRIGKWRSQLRIDRQARMEVELVATELGVDPYDDS